jgi:hypothetical protein
MKLKAGKWLFIASLVPLFSVGLRGAVVVDFSLSLETSVDGGLNYTDFTKAGAGTSDSFVIGFQVEITSVDGNAVNIGPIATFCSEIEESISAESYSFDLEDLSGLAAGRAGDTSTASSNIPSGGIGDLRAAQLAYLFDQYYISDEIGAWTMTDAEPNLHAFQLAVWEISHDDGLDLTSGEVFLGTQTGGSNPTRRANAVTLATTWLDNVDAAGITASYESSKFEFWSLVSTEGNTDGFGFQDIVLALEKDSTEETEFSGNIPEPRMSALLAGIFVLSIAPRVWRSQRKRRHGFSS